MMAAEDRMEQVEKEYPARASEARLMMPRGKEGQARDATYNSLECNQTGLRWGLDIIISFHYEKSK